MWYECRYEESNLEFHDLCYSVHCNDDCPDKLNLETDTINYYPDWAKAVIILIVISITGFSLVLKANDIH